MSALTLGAWVDLCCAFAVILLGCAFLATLAAGAWDE